MSASPTTLVRIEKPDPGTSVIVLDRPERMNSMAFELMVPLHEAFEKVAADNETTHHISFKNDQWYDVRLRVTERRVTAWVDGELIVNQKRKDRHFSVYMEVEPLRPLGMFSWQTGAAMSNVWMKRLTTEEAEDKAAPDEPDWW